MLVLNAWCWNISISCEFPVTWLVPFLLQLFIQLRARIMKHVREKKEPMRIQWIQLFIWKAPQTHTIAFCCLIFNIDKHNCIYLSSQYWKQAIICNITTLHLKGTQAQQFPVPSEGGEWHGGGWIAYAGEAHIIFFPHEDILILLLSTCFCTYMNDFWKRDLKASIFHVPNYTC